MTSTRLIMGRAPRSRYRLRMEKLAEVAESDRPKGAANLAKGPSARATKAAARAASLGPILAQIEAKGRRSLTLWHVP
jgi:hypothetical protein